jgi:hypothetical protein
MLIRADSRFSLLIVTMPPIACPRYGVMVSHDQIPVKPIVPSGTEWGLAQMLLGSTITVGYPCQFPCE